MSKFEIRCFFCGKTHSIEARIVDYISWCNGKLIQDAFPYLSTAEREMMISGLCPKCQKDIFGSEED